MSGNESKPTDAAAKDGTYVSVFKTGEHYR